MAPARAACT